MNRIIETREIADDPMISSQLSRYDGKWKQTAILFDFDGVLSPIQDDPETSVPASGVVDALAELCMLTPKVSIVSSRPADFLIGRFDAISELSILASYGLERVEAGRVELHPAVPDGWIRRIRESLGRAQNHFSSHEYTGVRVEDKGIALGIHFREVPTKSAVTDIVHWAAQEADRIGGLLKSGREVVEITCSSSIDKGTTVADEIANLSGACYFGDDLGDLPAFAALRAREESKHGFQGMAVAVANDAPVKAVMDAADLRLSDPNGVVTLLEIMIRKARTDTQAR